MKTKNMRFFHHKTFLWLINTFLKILTWILSLYVSSIHVIKLKRKNHSHFTNVLRSVILSYVRSFIFLLLFLSDANQAQHTLLITIWKERENKLWFVTVIEKVHLHYNLFLQATVLWVNLCSDAKNTKKLLTHSIWNYSKQPASNTINNFFIYVEGNLVFVKCPLCPTLFYYKNANAKFYNYIKQLLDNFEEIKQPLTGCL